MKYHINTKGEPSLCQAQQGQCPFGGESGRDNHFDDRRSAQASYEEQMQKHLFLTFSKQGKTPRLEKQGVRVPRSQEFAYLTSEARERFHKLGQKLAPLASQYVHDYDNDDPASREGEAEYLAGYDLARFGGRDTSADVLLMRPSPSGDDLQVLLILRKNHPYKNTWAHPGGFIDYNETVPEAAARELWEESGIRLQPEQMVFLQKYDHPKRDPRGRLKMNTHLALTTEDIFAHGEGVGDDAAQGEWVSVHDIFAKNLALCADHKQSVRDAVQHLSTMQPLASNAAAA